MNDLAIFNEHSAKISIFVQPIKALVVKDAASAATATDMLREAMRLSKGIEEQRKNFVGPLNARVKGVNDYAKKVTADLDASIKGVKEQLRKWEIDQIKVREAEKKAADEKRAREEEEARASAARQVEEQAQQPAEDDWGDMFGAPAATTAIDVAEAELNRALGVAEAEASHQATMTAIATEHKQAVKAAEATKVKGARRVWKHRLVNIDIVPREFQEILVDDFKVRQKIRDTEDPSTLNIPGLEIYEDVVIAAGRS